MSENGTASGALVEEEEVIGEVLRGGGRMAEGRKSRACWHGAEVGIAAGFWVPPVDVQGAEPGAAETFPTLGGGQNPGAVFIKFLPLHRAIKYLFKNWHSLQLWHSHSLYFKDVLGLEGAREVLE